MAIQKLTIEEFLVLAQQYPVLDVRSPGEYAPAHIPGAYNLPLFSDEERKAVGTAYKQQNREAAIKIGLDYFGVKMKVMVEEVEKIVGSWELGVGKEQKKVGSWQLAVGKEQKKIGNSQLTVDKGQTANGNKLRDSENSQPLTANCVLVHCWRGGMRSAGVAWLLDLYGFKVYTLIGGYKAYRKWVLSQFEKDYHFNIIGGYTGSGKTLLLHELTKQNQIVVDLEALACHKGSAFGAFGEKEQPRQEMFENLLAGKLRAASHELRAVSIWLEDESQRIGNLQIPMPLWYTMRRSPVYFLDIPFEERLSYLVEEYGKFEKEKLVNAIIRIQKRLGGLETKNAINHLLENDRRECFRILLTYYDKWYGKALFNRENITALLNKIPCSSVDTTANIKKLLSCEVVSTS